MAVNAYFASVVVDFLRAKLMEQEFSFTFETVMSHRSKVELLAKAQAAGYRTYLYYVATDDPQINISRLQNRVKLNGHKNQPQALFLSRIDPPVSPQATFNHSSTAPPHLEKPTFTAPSERPPSK